MPLLPIIFATNFLFAWNYLLHLTNFYTSFNKNVIKPTIIIAEVLSASICLAPILSPSDIIAHLICILRIIFWILQMKKLRHSEVLYCPKAQLVCVVKSRFEPRKWVQQSVSQPHCQQLMLLESAVLLEASLHPPDKLRYCFSFHTFPCDQL